MPDDFGRYQLLELIGRGGMGEVYRAHDTVRDRIVALKVLPDYLAGDESFETRFRRESQMAAKLNEPHIIPIHDFGEIDGRLFIDMRLVEGHDLGSVLRTRGTLPVAMAVELIAQVASALDAAHRSGLVHRDVKPSNILLTGPDGADDGSDAVPFAYLVDFGIARSANQEGTALTATTATVGTVAYMSPERINGSSSDLRTDVYALACVLYETLTGRKPYEGEMFAQMYAHMNTAPPRASERRPEVPPQLDAVIVKGMAKDPDQRYAGAGVLAAAARAALRDAARTDTMRGPALDPAARPPAGGPPGGRSPEDRPQEDRSSPDHRPDARPPSSPPHRPVAPDARSDVWTPPPPARTAGTPILGAPVLGAPNSGTPPFGTGPLPPQRQGPGRAAGSGRSRRTALIAAAVVVVLAIGAAVAFVATRGSDSPSADRSTSAPPSGGGSSTGPSSGGATAAAGPVLRTGSASTPTVSWQHFAAFSKLIGTRDNDTSAAYDKGTCKLSGPGSADSKLGIRDEVNCTYTGSTKMITVARFGSQALLNALIDDRVDVGFRQLVWTAAGQPRGLTLVSPHDGTGPASLSSSICGLPTYLVQISSPDRTKVSTLELHDDTYSSATFPDATPAACDGTFHAAQASAATSASVGPAKDVLTMNYSVIEALAEQGDTTVPVVQVPTKAGVEAIAVGQKGKVTFWSEVDDALQRVGSSTYPYSSSLGSPEAAATGAVLTGMTDVTFVVHGTFSGDGSGNAVAYTNGSSGWGAIKAQSDGSLKPSGQGVGIGGIGLGDDFALAGGRLQTFDCSSQLPVAQCSGNDRVIKYWTWRTNRFVQTGSAGRTR